MQRVINKIVKSVNLEEKKFKLMAQWKVFANLSFLIHPLENNLMILALLRNKNRQVILIS